MSLTHLLSPVDILWKTMEEHGFDAEDIFLKEGITHEMILRPGLRISHVRIEKLYIVIRGIEQKPIFKDSQDYQSFIERLGTILSESSTPCFARVLMTNHATCC